MRVLVTGGSGYIGTQLCRALAREPGIEEIVVVDLKPPAREVERVRFVARSVTEGLTDLVADRARPVDVVAHLAWNVDPLRDPAKQREVCIGGTYRVLEACAVGRPRQLLFVSSATAYGANPAHTRPLGEFDELKDHYHFQYSAEKREAELLCRRFAKDHPATVLQVARPVVVGGPNVSNFLFRSLHRPVLMTPLGHDNPIQLVHEEDVARALAAIIQSGVPGAFNLAGEGGLTIRESLGLIGRRPMPLPLGALRLVNEALWRLDVRSMVEAPSGFLYFLAYPWQVSTRRIRDELGFSFRLDARQVLDSYLKALRGRPSPSPS